ncbi:RNA polymerase sigma factor [Dyadobacter helix]|uniref:RNA polymerase sigma factor n=1 Tax=Dyadobacter helix TaxID=2822344 RepID=UPI001BFC6BC7|nr:RNA polymerase sigma factor [Dyadobacter sp. CECT 9275]
MEWLSDCTSDEREWIERCAKRDSRAQRWVFKHFFGLAMGIGLRYLSSKDMAQEVVNDAFLKIFDQLPQQLYTLKSFRGWMRTLVVHTAIDCFRKEKKNDLISGLNGYDDQFWTAEDASGNQSVAEILRLLDKLPSMWKVVFNLYEVEGYSHEEIAKMMHIPAASSRAYLTKAKQSLRKLITIQNRIN